jgi:hypothetical protein
MNETRQQHTGARHLPLHQQDTNVSARATYQEGQLIGHDAEDAARLEAHQEERVVAQLEVRVLIRHAQAHLDLKDHGSVPDMHGQEKEHSK